MFWIHGVEFLFYQKGNLWVEEQVSAEYNSWPVRKPIFIHWIALAMVVYLGECWILGFLGFLLDSVFGGFALVFVLNTNEQQEFS